MGKRKKKKSVQRYQRDMARLEKHLQSKCLVCLGSLEVPSSRLSCCRKRVHEECLLKWFVHSEGRLRTSCPHCKQSIFPFNLTEGPPPVHPFRVLSLCIYACPFRATTAAIGGHRVALSQSKTNSRTTPGVGRLSPAWSGYACLGSKLKCKL